MIAENVLKELYSRLLCNIVCKFFNNSENLHGSKLTNL